jgi:anti-anti-sigma factor
MIENQQQGDRLLARIEGEMTIYQAVEQHQALQQLIGSGKEIELDLSQVNEIDCAGLQLLLALKREAREADQSLHYANHSRQVAEIIQLFGLAGLFGDPILLSD